MSTLTEIVKSILVIIILASFLELLLPEGGLKPFVRFSIGLFILISVLNPVLSFLFKDQSLEINLWDYQVDSAKGEDIINKGKNLNQEMVAGNQKSIQEKLQGQISSVAMLVPGVTDAETEVQMNREGNPEKLRITVKPGQAGSSRQSNKVQVFSENQTAISTFEKEEVESKIKRLVSNLYGYDSNDIEVEFEGR
ncbi:MAG: stage III sporulation protein AF [Syntrophomonas sp.]